MKGGKNKTVVRLEKELVVENRLRALQRVWGAARGHRCIARHCSPLTGPVQRSQMKSSIAAGIAHMAVFSFLYNKYDGRAVRCGNAQR